ncbi:hypothetical protein B0H19DRAFT_1091383 [Mycena capillaripes]|nr:hypothetical protein B0H19DRAFT_1091383 [Mycena capillaripes]
MSLTETIPTPPSLPPSLPRSSATFTSAPSIDRTPSTSSPTSSPNSHLRNPRSQKSFSSISTRETDEAAWGSNFWVTLVDPQTQTSFFACPATGQVSWDPPVGNFVLPPSAEGEWWELSDESRGGLPYYYQTKTGETVWERPSSAFVIPLGIIQNTALGRRLSQTAFNRFSNSPPGDVPGPSNTQAQTYRRSRSYTGPLQGLQDKNADSPRRSDGRRSSSDHRHSISRLPPNLPTIPGSSPDNSDVSSSPSSRKSTLPPPSNNHARSKDVPNGKPRLNVQPQSLNAAVELLTSSQSENGHGSQSSAKSPKLVIPSSPTRDKSKPPPSPRRPIPPTPTARSASAPMIAGKVISAPKLNHAATMEMSPVKNRAAGKPIPVEPRVRSPTQLTQTATLGSGKTYPILPQDLASDILQFSRSDFARQYFSTHRTGFIFRRRVPVTQMMTWQKAPLHSPLLTLHRSLGKDAVKVFKVIQHIMGDRDRDKPVGVRMANDNHVSTVASINASTTSLAGNAAGIREEERWLLGEGISHGELRDEIYCQTMKQLTGNPNPESVFKGWQLLCVLLITFPPSKNFETYLRSFIQQHTTHQEGRVDVMAKYCVKRLTFIAKKGPRGKPPASAEIETASDAAFNPSTFGESLDAIFRLQERNYPQQKVPIILPFLADGILALGGSKSEGIFRVPGDGDSVSELKLRIDKGYYTLDGVDDPHVLASLMKLWLRELCDPLVPDEMYNECITNSKDPTACVHIVERLPTINRRVVLFVISFLQLFLEERIQGATKMTPANLALVMAPNLLRCDSDSMSVVFTNAQYEQIFVYNLLLHLKCGEIDEGYKPAHGLGAVSAPGTPRNSKSRSRRPPH